MTTLINDMPTWQEYRRISEAISTRNLYVDRDRDKIPANILEMILSKTPLTPSDLSHDLLKEMFIISANRLTSCYSVDKLNESVIDLFIQYLRKDEMFLKHDPSYQFGKGLLLRGPVGSGKTLIFKTLQELQSRLKFFNTHKELYFTSDPDRIYPTTSNEIVKRFCLDGFMIFQPCNGDGSERKLSYVDLIDRIIFIDDIGSEPEGSHYGVKTNVIGELIQIRYEKGRVTHATSNLGVDALEKAYGLRVYDRMREMFNDITLTGSSRRK